MLPDVPTSYEQGLPEFGKPRLQAGRDAAVDVERMPVDEG